MHTHAFKLISNIMTQLKYSQCNEPLTYAWTVAWFRSRQGYSMMIPLPGICVVYEYNVYSTI